MKYECPSCESVVRVKGAPLSSKKIRVTCPKCGQVAQLTVPKSQEPKRSRPSSGAGLGDILRRMQGLERFGGL